MGINLELKLYRDGEVVDLDTHGWGWVGGINFRVYQWGETSGANQAEALSRRRCG